ncbi:MAG TPA: hypothetical protein VFT79_03770 [Solirubrobacterales bacterium]|nr:hypothetical protein [Solirubrobacterales bacterium]
MNRHPIFLIALTAALALLFAAVAFADLGGNSKVWCAGNICVTDDGGIAPDELPKRGKAPVTARLNGKIETRDGTHPPALQSIDLDIDKTIGIDAVGLPTCKSGQIQSRTSAAARKACGSAIVGSGRAEVEVAFPEQAPFRSTGPLALFNGGVQGRATTVLLHAYVNVPAPTAIVTRATITRINRGRFGLHIAAEIPKIAGGSGSVTMFDLEVGRKFTYKGKRKSFLLAGCPTGTWVTKGQALFKDGTRLSITHPFSCTPVG